MALPTSGAISISDIAGELGISPIGLSLNDSRCRNLAGKLSGQIALSDFYGKNAIPTYILTIGRLDDVYGASYDKNAWQYGNISPRNIEHTNFLGFKSTDSASWNFLALEGTIRWKSVTLKMQTGETFTSTQRVAFDEKSTTYNFDKAKLAAFLTSRVNQQIPFTVEHTPMRDIATPDRLTIHSTLNIPTDDGSRYYYASHGSSPEFQINIGNLADGIHDKNGLAYIEVRPGSLWLTTRLEEFRISGPANFDQPPNYSWYTKIRISTFTNARTAGIDGWLGIYTMPVNSGINVILTHVNGVGGFYFGNHEIPLVSGTYRGVYTDGEFTPWQSFSAYVTVNATSS